MPHYFLASFAAIVSVVVLRMIVNKYKGRMEGLGGVIRIFAAVIRANLQKADETKDFCREREQMTVIAIIQQPSRGASNQVEAPGV